MVLFLPFGASLLPPLAGVSLHDLHPARAAGGVLRPGALIYRRLLRKKVVISVAAAGLSIDQQPGDVFSFQDAQLGQWSTHGTGGNLRVCADVLPYAVRACWLA
jgi:hypothetical protein